MRAWDKTTSGWLAGWLRGHWHACPPCPALASLSFWYRLRISSTPRPLYLTLFPVPWSLQYRLAARQSASVANCRCCTATTTTTPHVFISLSIFSARRRQGRPSCATVLVSSNAAQENARHSYIRTLAMDRSTERQKANQCLWSCNACVVLLCSFLHCPASCMRTCMRASAPSLLGHSNNAIDVMQCNAMQEMSKARCSGFLDQSMGREQSSSRQQHDRPPTTFSPNVHALLALSWIIFPLSFPPS
ncbi:hypothetical protein IWX49DRAFT_70005 [Phyllosticta citricarpa]